MKKAKKTDRKSTDSRLGHSVNDVIAVVRYAKVLQRGADNVEVEDLDHGNQFYVRGNSLVDSLDNASVYEKTEKLPLTQVAEKVSSAFGIPVSVCFDKKEGEERVLVGRLKSAEPLLGRSYYEDLEVPRGEHRLRQVDHRTLKWAIINKVKYVVK